MITPGRASKAPRRFGAILNIRMGRTGSADLPLHGGRVPPWLATRMASLGRVLVEALVHHYGRDELLRRLAHPFWFQSLGCVMGMDWHSSGITTSVLGALKRGLAPVEHELGLHVCGGRGRHSRKTPDELRALGERIGFDGDALAHTSKLVAKVDSAAVQDGYQLYLHGFVVADDGKWVVVQQGMRPEQGAARRYHWLSEGVRDFVDEPHAAITSLGGVAHGDIVNLTDRRADTSRTAQLELVARGPDAVLPHLMMPHHHDVRPSRRSSATDARHPRGGGRARADRLRGSVDDAGPGRAHRRGARRGGRGGARRALPLHRSGALRARARGQGRPSLPGSAARLRSDASRSCGAPSTRPGSATTSDWRRSSGSTPKRAAWKRSPKRPRSRTTSRTMSRAATNTAAAPSSTIARATRARRSDSSSSSRATRRSTGCCSAHSTAGATSDGGSPFQ